MGDYPILTDSLQILENALVSPPEKKGGPLGVFDAQGSFLEETREFRPYFEPLPVPDRPDWSSSKAELKGTYLYAGWLQQQFGHAIVESTARLWPLKDYLDQVDGILFLSRGPQTIWRARKSNRQMLDYFCMGIPDIPITQPVRVERLIVGDAGCGIGPRMRGSYGFLDYLQSLPIPKFDGLAPRKIYLSRRKLRGDKGRYFGEARLAEYLSHDGYAEVFLEELPFATQVALIANADFILTPDGTPMHLISYFAPSKAKVGIIVRRRALMPRMQREQFLFLQKRDATYFDHVVGLWNNATEDSVYNTVLAEVDLAALSADLARNGFIEHRTSLDNLTRDEVASEANRLGRPRMELVGLEEDQSLLDVVSNRHNSYRVAGPSS